MIREVAKSLRWMLSLGGKFARVVPLQTFTIVGLTLVSQVSALLASFLPLKVVILLGSERLPRYLPDSWSVLEREVLIGLLCLGALGGYLVYLFTERLILHITSRGTQRLLLRSHKMALFENQDELAQEAYLSFTRALAGAVFISLALLGLGIFYPQMALLLLGYLLLAALLLGLLQRQAEGVRQVLQRRLTAVLAVTASLGFFAAFAYLVADFIFWTPPGVIIGIIALLLTRQVMQRLAAMVGDLVSLQRQQIKLDVLFFHGKVFMPALPGDKSEFWGLLTVQQRQAWVAEMLREFTPWRQGPLHVQWQQSGVANIASLLVNTEIGRFYIKLYDSNRRTFALHESTLLMERPAHLPALSLLGATQLGGMQCLLYVLVDGEFVSPRVAKKLQKSLLTGFMSVAPSDALRQRYMRSRPLLWQRLRVSLLERMQVAVADDEQQQGLDALLACLPQLNGLLQQLPLWIATPDTGPTHLYRGADNQVVLLNWSRWYMEPVAAGWPMARLDDLPAVLLQVQAVRKDMEGVSVRHLELAALSAALEVSCNAQRYTDAMALLPNLLSHLEICLQCHVSA